MLSQANQQIHEHLKKAYEWCLRETEKGRLYPLKGYEGLYGITESGDVWAYPKRNHMGGYIHGGMWLKLRPGRIGYVQVALQRKEIGKKKYPLVHRLVAQTFIPNPKNKRVVNHKDGNKQNNHVLNLEWATDKENSQHAWDTGLRGITKEMRKSMHRNLVVDGVNTRFKKKTHCKRGHLLSIENLYLGEGSYRQCKLCSKLRYEKRKLQGE